MNNENNHDSAENQIERNAILVGVQLPGTDQAPIGMCLDELKGLAETAFYNPLLSITQNMTTPNPKTFLGSGKVDELQKAVKFHNAKTVIFDDRLSPAQNRNLETALKCRVIDRPWLILEIFSDHAKTREAKTQVELARLKYALPRLTKMWGHLSRQRGGIGMKDVGETQIQLDRRLIRDRISKLEKKLGQIDREKQTQRKSRSASFKVALVGYTNAGKSTLMNQLTEAGALTEDKLFATLDATIRKIKKNFPYPTLVSDTVGLIDKLPHDLIASFKSTLDEARDSDLLLKVVDIGDPNFRNHIKTTDNLLQEMGLSESPAIQVFNKIDQIEDAEFLRDIRGRFPEAVFLSGKKGVGMEELRQSITNSFEKRLTTLRANLSYNDSNTMNKIRKLALIVNEEYTEDGLSITIKATVETKSRLLKLIESSSRHSSDNNFSIKTPL
jgi:GTP-binding protein HflX